MSRFHSLTHLLHLSIQTKNLRSIKTLHAHLLKTGLLSTSLNLHTGLILSYTTCLPNNHHLLPIFLTSINLTDPLPFNTIISMLSQNGLPFMALRTLSFMHSNGVCLDSYSLCTSLKAALLTKSLELGKQVHALVIKLGFVWNVYVGSVLIGLYAKRFVLNDACKVFDEIPARNTVCANALLSGFEEAQMWGESLNLVRLMRRLGMDFDRFTLSAIVRVSAGLSMIELGRQAHGNLFRAAFSVQEDLFLQSSLIEMYGKCGFVEKAQYVFGLMGIRKKETIRRDVVLWTSIIGAYSRNGRFEDIIVLFKDMLLEGVRPDRLVFLAVISACGCSGYVSLGLQYFESMIYDFGLEPDSEHYSCVVDMLCKAGELEKACEFVKGMPIQGSVSMWGALLSASTDCENVEIGEFAARGALELDPQNVAIYVLLSNLYARVGLWDGTGELREVMKQRRLTKDVGCSWIEIAS